MSERSATELVTTSDFLESAWDGETILPDTRDELVGTTLNGSYVVERLLGEGGMGRVYLARHTRIEQKRVAIKVLHQEYASNEEVLVRFQREAEAAASVTHPNVMTVLDVDRTPQGAPYLVCEYLEGIDLGAHLKKVKKLETSAALHLARALCHGLAAAHEKSVIHRDLKPQNVFLLGDLSLGAAAEPDLKIVDFGLSRFLDDDTGDQLTKTGYIMGTPAYMAPEQARGLRVDQRVDVYGVGAILYTLLTGRPPFDEDTPQATVLAVVSSEPPRPRSLVPSIPLSVEVLLERALAKEPADRYPDMKALLAAIDALLLQGVDPPALAPKERDPASRGSRPDSYAGAPRARLIGYVFLCTLLAIVTTITAVTGIELANGYGFNRVELRLLLLAILGIGLTPTLFALLHVRSRVWSKSSRVLELLARLRAALLAGAASYGAGALLLFFYDDFLRRILPTSRLPELGAHWPGWNLMLGGVAASVALGVTLQGALAGKGGFVRRALRALVLLLTLAAVSAVVYFGFRWHARSAHPQPGVTRAA